MATTVGSSPGEGRRGVASPRPKGRENTPCRNIAIYGRCKYEDTCAYNHTVYKPANTQNQVENSRNRLNVDSPSFTPLQPSTNGLSNTKTAAISPQAANAKIFTPKTSKAPTPVPPAHAHETSSEWGAQGFQEFVPGNYDASQLADPGTVAAGLMNAYVPFSSSSAVGGIGGGAQAQINPYSQETSNVGAGAFFQGNNTYAQPLQYHLYAPLGPHRDRILAYQRTSHDFFMPDNIREDLQRKSEATRQTLPTSSLPASIEHFHSLVPLDTNHQKNATLFGYPSWIYKAVSGKDGLTYALRRLEGFRLTNENAIRSVQAWKRINSGSVVTIHDAFTTRAFGDSSLILVTDYHPLAKTLAEQHLSITPRFQGGRPPANHVPEQVLWGYIVQIANALKAIHGNGLAARVIHPSKVIITSKNRVRLNACAILDVVQYDSSRPIADVQQEDLLQMGRLIVIIASNSSNAFQQNMQKTMDNLSRLYSARLNECVTWLLTPMADKDKMIDSLLYGISDQLVTALDSSFHTEDSQLSALNLELENGRLVRMMTKLNFINERPELEHQPQWSETGERYYLKLFRDYVFHAVDANNHPVTDLAHVMTCLNKLDAGSDEKITLVSRDEQNVFVVSYKELKRSLENAFQDLVKAGRRS